MRLDCGTSINNARIFKPPLFLDFSSPASRKESPRLSINSAASFDDHSRAKEPRMEATLILLMKRVLRFCILSHLWFLKSFLRKQFISNMIKVKGLNCHRCQNKKRSLSFAYNDKRISVLCVLREAKGNICYSEQVSKYCNC